MGPIVVSGWTWGHVIDQLHPWISEQPVVFFFFMGDYEHYPHSYVSEPHGMGTPR